MVKLNLADKNIQTGLDSGKNKKVIVHKTHSKSMAHGILLDFCGPFKEENKPLRIFRNSDFMNNFHKKTPVYVRKCFDSTIIPNKQNNAISFTDVLRFIEYQSRINFKL